MYSTLERLGLTKDLSHRYQFIFRTYAVDNLWILHQKGKIVLSTSYAQIGKDTKRDYRSIKKYVEQAIKIGNTEEVFNLWAEGQQGLIGYKFEFERKIK